ncbi:Hypothetical predicted protein [Octopus vulgaris]|uniref:Olfactomedin-like domain-containing protein n=1 Tax=Octopus vulgaris TaxID=6645 RepID=A0AA36BGR4_OCTVU|nr:Hypothetical predicted protein [Octopus vulgaris]
MGEHYYQGVGHLIYRRSFYFHLAHTSKVARYSLAEQKVVTSSKNMPKAISTGERSLYSFQYNYFDFAVDENGIWVLYGKNSSEETLIVVKLDGDTLQILKKWELPIKHRSYGNAFIVCGVLYLVQSVSKPKTKVEIVYDLYADVKLCKVLDFSNPFGHNYMIAFYHKKIYGYDNGNEITYPVLMYDRKELETLMKSYKGEMQAVESLIFVSLSSNNFLAKQRQRIVSKNSNIRSMNFNNNVIVIVQKEAKPVLLRAKRNIRIGQWIREEVIELEDVAT